VVRYALVATGATITARRAGGLRTVGPAGAGNAWGAPTPSRASAPLSAWAVHAA